MSYFFCVFVFIFPRIFFGIYCFFHIFFFFFENILLAAKNKNRSKDPKTHPKIAYKTHGQTPFTRTRISKAQTHKQTQANASKHTPSGATRLAHRQTDRLSHKVRHITC